jgi:hypothetical protein
MKEMKRAQEGIFKTSKKRFFFKAVGVRIQCPLEGQQEEKKLHLVKMVESQNFGKLSVGTVEGSVGAGVFGV